MVKTDTLPVGGSRTARPLRVPTPLPFQVPARPTSTNKGGPRTTNRNVSLPSNAQFLQQCGLARPLQPAPKVAETSLRGPRACVGLANGDGGTRAGRGACVGRAAPLRTPTRSAIPVRVACQPTASDSSGPSRAFPRASPPWTPVKNVAGSPDRHSSSPVQRIDPRNQNVPCAAPLMSKPSKKEMPPGAGVGSGQPSFATSFQRLLQGSTLTIPPALLRGLERQENAALGRVKVMLRVASTAEDADGGGSFMEIDARQKQLTVYEPDTSLGPAEERRVGVAAPKMFAFDAIFSPDDSQDRVCSKTLGDVLPAVVHGSDACVFTYGYSKLGKSRTMVGGSESTQDPGLIPCAIAWLFRMIHEQKQKTGARFSVRISAAEIAGKTEVLRDLLASYANGTEGCLFSPAKYLREDPVFGRHLQNQSELRAPTADKAAFYLDAALAASRAAAQETDGVTHFVFTLHVYQYRVDKTGKGGVAGGRSRLYFVDLGGCEKQSQVFGSSKSYRLSLANLGNVILAIFNGQKHVPYKDSKLTQMLREILGNITCRATMIAHVSPLPTRYTDSLATIQLASRIHRLRHKRWKNLHSGDGGASIDDPIRRFQRRDGPRSSGSDVDCTSSSEQSCDTVIFVGPREKTLHEGVESAPASEPAAMVPTSVARPGFAQIRRMTGGRVLTQPAAAATTLLFPFRAPCNVGETTVRSDGFVAVETDVGPKPSDEFWVDGPRVHRSNFEAFRTEWLYGNLRGGTGTGLAAGVELWVDGPQAPATAPSPMMATRRCDLHFLDDHKRAMIERWIEMQTSALQLQQRGVCVAMDGDATSAEDPSSLALEDPSLKEAEIVSNVDSFVSGDTEEPDRGASEELAPPPSHRADDVRVEQADFYRRVLWHLTESTEEPQTPPCHIDFGICSSSDDDGSDPRVSTMDSWVQVTEDEILLACRSLLVDDDVDEDDDDHPLRILSSESLAISFTNSSRMSWDSGLNAMRHAFALAAAAAAATSDTGLSPDSFDAQSVRSDPGSASSRRPSLTVLGCNAFVSRSLEDVSEPTDVGGRRPDCRYCGLGDDASDVCSCAECCSRCRFGRLRFCPDGASDPHLDRHPSALDVAAVVSSPFVSKPEDDGNSCRFFPERELRKEYSPPGGVERMIAFEPDLNGAWTHAKADGSGPTRNVSKTTAAAFCCAVGFSRPMVSDGSSNASSSSESSKALRSGFETSGWRRPTSPREDSAVKNDRCVDCERWPTDPRFEEIRGPRQATKDKAAYDSGTGSSGGSTSSNGGGGGGSDEKIPKTHASLGTSSGYESMPRGSEGSDSLVSHQDSVSLGSDETNPSIARDPGYGGGANPSEERRESPRKGPGGGRPHLGSFELIAYDEEDVERMERRRRLEKSLRQRRRRSKIVKLRQRQEELKKELALAKSLIMADPCKWSYELHVEESMDAEDPSFVEALQKETEILEKRVTACKSHLTVVTCFDATRARGPPAEPDARRYGGDVVAL